MESYELPLGLGMALLQNPSAMEQFSKLNEQERQKIIHGTQAITSKEEMQQYVKRMLISH